MLARIVVLAGAGVLVAGAASAQQQLPRNQQLLQPPPQTEGSWTQNGNYGYGSDGSSSITNGNTTFYTNPNGSDGGSAQRDNDGNGYTMSNGARVVFNQDHTVASIYGPNGQTVTCYRYGNAWSCGR